LRRGFVFGFRGRGWPRKRNSFWQCALGHGAKEVKPFVEFVLAKLRGDAIFNIRLLAKSWLLAKT
jgi:hypothetical protein